MIRRTFAVDIDGTITEDGAGRIHLGALGALRRLADMGHSVVFVTGRSSVEGFLLAAFGGTTPVAVGENGGCITHGDGRHVLLGDISCCRRALGALRGALPGVEEKPVFPRMTEVVLERTFALEEGRAALERAGAGAVLSDSGYAYHLNAPGVDKGAGLARALGILGADPAGVVAIGDSATDLPMFRAAGTSVALGNAPAEVRSAASMAVSAAAGDGVLEALDTLAPTFSGV